jgi:hypothetical protein
MHSSSPQSCYKLWPSHTPWLDHSNYVYLGKSVQVMKLLVMQFLQPPVTSSLFCKTIFFRALFSNSPSLRFSLNVRDQISRPYRSTVKIMVLNILIYKFLDRRQEDKSSLIEWQQVLPELNLLLISSRIKFWFAIVVLKYLNCAIFSTPLLSVFISWICPAFWWRDSNKYLVFSAFASRRIFLLASIKVSVFCGIYIISQLIHIISIDQHLRWRVLYICCMGSIYFSATFNWNWEFRICYTFCTYTCIMMRQDSRFIFTLHPATVGVVGTAISYFSPSVNASNHSFICSYSRYPHLTETI